MDDLFASYYNIRQMRSIWYPRTYINRKQHKTIIVINEE